MEQGQGAPPPPPATEREIGFAERAVAAAGAAVISAVLVNPLDVAKVPGDPVVASIASREENFVG
jgi:solute carrier family 25 protein 39/40